MGQTNTLVHPRTAYAEPRVSPAPRAAAVSQSSEFRLALHESVAAAERDWRRLEERADSTPFQTFAWLSAWQQHIGSLQGVKPAIIVGKRGDEVLFLLPLAVEGGLTRRLTFLGQDLCDYNAPMLARDFTAVIGREKFAALFHEALRLIQATPALRHDTIALAKMPEVVGTQPNPMLFLDVRLNPSGAYETVLGTEWEQFYTGKRSSATRRRDRTKVKRLGEMGAVQFVNPDDAGSIAATLEVLIAQKSKQFGRMGVPNMFARPGHIEFFRAIAAERTLVHLSRLDVGTTWAAVNLGLTHRGCYFHVLASYDDGEVSRFGPGAAHLRELLKNAIARGLNRFDFTIGDEPYKRDWCETEQRLHDYSAAVTLRGWPSFALATGWRRVKRAIKQGPLWSVVVRARAAVASMRKKPAAAPAKDEE